MNKETGHFTTEKILALDKDNRTNLINSLSGFKSAGLIGTKSHAGQHNLAIFNSFIHIGANPPLIGFVCRPGSVERHTLENILETGFYTINYITEIFYKQAHQTSARYTRDQSEFEETKLTVAFKNNFFAPFVGQSPIQIGIEFKEKIDISINNTILMIGQITDLFYPKEILQSDGFMDLEAAGAVICNGLNSYYNTKKIARLAYAKVGTNLKEIN